MKKVLTFTLLLFACFQLFAQTEGISYQAVIIGPDGLEIPGVDAQGNILPNAEIALRFTIIDANNLEEYQEIQTTNTDRYGRINLVIGQINPDGFSLINWDGTSKDLKVEIDFSGGGTSFVDMSRQELNFVPYAYHRNIIARGRLIVDDLTDLNGELTVAGPANLNSTLTVHNNNATDLTGDLTVGGATNIGNDLTVNGVTNLNDQFNLNNGVAANFSGDVTVAAGGTATFNGPTSFAGASSFNDVTVSGPSRLNGQVTVNANMDSQGGDGVYNAYPLLVQGSKQGIAIKVTGNRSTSNNYLSFWDDNQMWGRIEGQTSGDLWSDPEHILETANLGVASAIALVDFGIAGFEVIQAGVELTARGTATTVCVGFGACATVPPPSMIVSGATNLVLKIANAVAAGANLALTAAELIEYQVFVNTQIGVTYQSGSGDYAEWLPKRNPEEKFYPGDIVGVTNGNVTKSTSGADRVMVISNKPIVLGNMPPDGEEYKYEKIAFMGQVPVKVMGKVEPGDYILPTLIGNGFGKAVAPEEMSISDYNRIVGVAWSGSEGENIGAVNVAVGLNTNDLVSVVLSQDEKLQSLEAEVTGLQQQINQATDLLCQLVAGFEEAMEENPDFGTRKSYFLTTDAKQDPPEKDQEEKQETYVNANTAQEYLMTPRADEIIYFDITEEQLEESINIAREIYLESSGKSLEDHPFWKKMNEEPAYVEEVKKEMKTNLQKAFKIQKSINQKFANKPISVK